MWNIFRNYIIYVYFVTFLQDLSNVHKGKFHEIPNKNRNGNFWPPYNSVIILRWKFQCNIFILQNSKESPRNSSTFSFISAKCNHLLCPKKNCLPHILSSGKNCIKNKITITNKNFYDYYVVRYICKYCRRNFANHQIIFKTFLLLWLPVVGKVTVTPLQSYITSYFLE